MPVKISALSPEDPIAVPEVAPAGRIAVMVARIPAKASGADCPRLLLDIKDNA